MFDHYVQVQSRNPRWRRAMIGAGVVSGTFTASLLVFMWVMNRLQIRRVEPPRHSIVLVQRMADEVPPPPPPPPPPPAGSSESASEPEPEVAQEPELPEPPIELEQPKEIPKTLDEPIPKQVAGPPLPGAPRKGLPGDPKFGMPGGTGIPGVPGMLGGLGPGVAVKREPKKEEIAREPIASVRRNALYTPDCDAKKLATTRASIDRRSGSTKLAFCVNESGKVEDLRTVHKFPNYPEVDQICRDTVAMWRFKPFQVAGRPVKTCTEIEFRIVIQ